MDTEAFIARWTAREGGAERANYQMFLAELCDVIGVPRPEPAGAERGQNDYVFERAVRPRDSDGSVAPKRIDLYKRNAFILEAKQSRLPGAKNAIPCKQVSLLADEPEQLGRKSVARGWDVMMQNARKQAENYVFLLDADHAAPPFIITCDVGHALEVFADFTGTGRAYSQFPDRKGFRIYLEDLRRPETRELLAKIWTDPASLDPAKESARVTREIAKRLAEVSKALEADHPAEDVAHFLMRCIWLAGGPLRRANPRTAGCAECRAGQGRGRRPCALAAAGIPDTTLRQGGCGQDQRDGFRRDGCGDRQGPADRYEQPLAVEALLSAAGRPMAAAEIARGFKRGGKKIEKRVDQVLTTLARYGRVTPLPGDRFAARKAA